MAPILMHYEDGSGQRDRVFTQAFTIGRESADLALADKLVSTVHAYVYPDGPFWVIEDAGSMNGTWLQVVGYDLTGCTRLRAPHKIGKGQRFRLGRTVITAVPTG